MIEGLITGRSGNHESRTCSQQLGKSLQAKYDYNFTFKFSIKYFTVVLVNFGKHWKDEVVSDELPGHA